MPDAELDILIRTLADTHGVDETWEALNKYKTALKGSGEGAEQHNHAHREMHMLFRQLNGVLPESGHLLHGLFGGPTVLLVMATVVAVSKLVEVVKEHRKELEEAKKLAAEMESAVWLKQQENLRNVRHEYEQFNIQLAATARAYDALKASQETAMAMQQEYDKAREKGAGKDEERVEQLKRLAEANKILMEQAQLRQLEETKEAAQTTLDTAHEAVLKAAEASGPAGSAAKGIAGAQAKYDKAIKDREEAERSIEPGKLAMMTPMMQGYTLLSYKNKMEKVTEELELAKNQLVTFNAQQDAYNRQLEAAKQAQKEAEEQVRNRSSQISEKQAAINKERGVLGAQVEASDEQQLLGAGVSPGALRAPIGRSIIRGIEAAEARAHGDKITADQLNTVDGLVRAMRLAGVTNEKIQAILKEMMDRSVSHEQKIQDLWNAMKVTKQRIAATVNP